ncbi:MAG: hypothetical protein KAT14_03600 [Candidatus Marinimicrobia bacterium]|nr:hypothetical protein [Candidatus Neomarinimicrobiota bacterium]
MEYKYCPICKKETKHDSNISDINKCVLCFNAVIEVKKICEDMSVCRQAVYAKADRKGFIRRFKYPEKGKRYRVFTEDEAFILVNEDCRLKDDGLSKDGVWEDAEVPVDGSAV